MTSYKYQDGNLNVNLPFDTFNIIKNKNGSAHYFFNGFEHVKGTDEIVIKLIRANEHLSDYVNVIYNGKRKKNIKFSYKYEFINFNDIKDQKIKIEIAAAIKINNKSDYDDFFNIKESSHENNYSRTNIEAVDGDTFDYDGTALNIDEHLAELITSYKKTPAIPDLTAFGGTGTAQSYNPFASDVPVGSLNSYGNGSSISIGNNSNIASSDYGSITIRDDANSFIVDNPSAIMINDGTTKITHTDNPIIVSRNKRKINNKIILSPAKLIIL